MNNKDEVDTVNSNLSRKSSLVMMYSGRKVSDPNAFRPLTSIIATIGPSTNSVEKLCELIDAGMSCIRMNTAHGDINFHKSIVENANKACEVKKTLVALMLDIKGPEIRTCRLKTNELRGGRREWPLTANEVLKIVNDRDYVGDTKCISTTYKKLPKTVVAGSKILIADGLIGLTVISTDNEKVVKCNIDNSAILGENKNMNIPGHVIDLPAVTEKDKEFVQFGIKYGVDFIAGSFIRKARDIEEIRNLPGVKESRIHIIAKIESQEGIDNFDQILSKTDMVMIGRGDLGVEVPLAKVATIQKEMIHKCNVKGIPVIIATQMLDSMITNPRPTRAEVSDVYNAVTDGTDCVMLSAETANGAYPINAVKIMSSICLEAESHIDHKKLFLKFRKIIASNNQSVAESVASSAVRISWDIKASLIIALSKSGNTARLVSKYRPHCPILAVTTSRRIAATLLTVRGVNPYLVKSIQGAEITAEKGILKAYDNGLIVNGDFVVVTSGAHGGTTGETSMIRVALIKDGVQFVW